MKKPRKPGRKRFTVRRKGLNLTSNIVELVAILTTKRSRHLGNTQDESELMREALTTGLHVLIKEEDTQARAHETHKKNGAFV